MELLHAVAGVSFGRCLVQLVFWDILLVCPFLWHLAFCIFLFHGQKIDYIIIYIYIPISFMDLNANYVWILWDG